MDLLYGIVIGLGAFLMGAATMLGYFFWSSSRERWLLEQLAQRDAAILQWQQELANANAARESEIEKRVQSDRDALKGAQRRADDLMSKLVTLTLELNKRSKTEPKTATGSLYSKVKLIEAIARQLNGAEIQMIASGLAIELPEKATRSDLARVLVETAENRHIIMPLIEAAYARNAALEIL